MANKGKILLIASSTDTFDLKDGKQVATGYYLNELAIPAQAVCDAGYELVLVTPKGGKPVMDGHSPVADHFGHDEAALAKALEFVKTAPAMQNPRTLRSVIEEGLENYAGVFVPGGHAPMNDLMQDPDLGEILWHTHKEGKPTALLCHGPVAIAAAMPSAKEFRAALVKGDTDAAKAAAEGWQYEGYRMTVFSNTEENWAEDNLLKGKVQFNVVDALECAGGIVETKGNFEINVIEDRELITGQNPPSDHSISELFIKALDRKAAARKAA